jgi:hypothetical protein
MCAGLADIVTLLDREVHHGAFEVARVTLYSFTVCRALSVSEGQLG